MKYSLIRSIKLTAALGAAAMVATAAASAQTMPLDKYLVKSDDCVGCGPVELNNMTEVQAYMGQVNAHMSARPSRGFNGPSYGGFHRRSPWRNVQVVFLDFDAGGAPTFPVCRSDNTLFGIFNDHVYTPAERAEITERIAHDYGQFNFHVTSERPSSGDFTTIFMGQNDAPEDCSQGSNITVFPSGGVSILFGRAEGIDFLNKNKSDNAFAEASFWEFLAQLDPSGGLLEAFSGVSIAEFGSVEAAKNFAVVNQSANTGAHEAGHIQGLRHQNSFGAPGDGLPDTGAISPFEFVPVFPGSSDASETVLHTMASGASVGLSLNGSAAVDRFFSERSAARLAINQFGRVISEARVRGHRARRLRDRVLLTYVRVPNTIEEGQNENARIKVNAAVVNGEISAVDEVDSYTFRGRRGEFFNAELISVIGRDLSFAEGIMGQLRLYKVNRDGSETFVASNLQSFESLFDAEMFDIVLPENGLYRVEVTAPDEFFPADTNGDGELDAFPLEANGGVGLLQGKYSLQMYTCVKRLRRARSHRMASN